MKTLGALVAWVVIALGVTLLVNAGFRRLAEAKADLVFLHETEALVKRLDTQAGRIPKSLHRLRQSALRNRRRVATVVLSRAARF